ncbi:MAG: PilZ domain-containing protein [Nitrospira sp.]|nr:PilZ domain-containing protein [Nitrospira sp.]
MPKHFRLRTYQRALICGAGYYLSEDFLGKGTVWDMSSGGWRFQGDHQVTIDMLLTLRIELPEEKIPLEIEQAVVRWVSGKAFGVRIKKINRSAATTLERLMGHHLCILPPVEP